MILTLSLVLNLFCMTPTLIWLGFFSAAAIQLFYLLVIFGRFAFFFKPPKRDKPATAEGVSIVVAARNEAATLEKLVQSLSAQQYPLFEILVVNDRSEDGSRLLLEQMMDRYPRLRTVTVHHTPPHFNPKKYALTLGIKVAKYDIILLTDADCLPVSDRWITLMSLPLRTEQKTVALGHGAYERRSGFLNRLIQYETLFTAIAYFSFAVWKSPYMGVGRNLCYRKSFFLEKKAFKGFWHVNGGDDDLWVGEHAKGSDTAVVAHFESITLSLPKTAWKGYFAQKNRHYHAGKYYRTGDKLKIGAYMASNLIFWLCAFLLLISANTWEPIATVIGFTLLRAVAQMGVFSAAKKKLEGNGKVPWSLFFDLPYLGYFWILGVKGYLSKEIKWK